MKLTVEVEACVAGFNISSLAISACTQSTYINTHQFDLLSSICWEAEFSFSVCLENLRYGKNEEVVKFWFVVPNICKCPK